MGILAMVIGRSDRRSRRFLLAGSRLSAGAALAGLALLGTSVPASGQTLTWSVVHSPNPGSGFDVLEDVSCVSAAACTAVGWDANSGGGDRTLIESWNGTRWSVVPSPSPGPTGNVLYGVSCVSAAACTAVGDRQRNVSKTLIESWNGTRWSVVPSPSLGTSDNGILYGVSCVSAAACTAVGRYNGSSNIGSTLIESWNGTRWSVVPSPSPGTSDNILNGVSCVSAAACTAVGSYYSTGSSSNGTLVESWNGTSWSVVPPNPAPANLSDVSCASASACTAVGDYYIRFHGSEVSKTRVESWNGTSWSVVPSPNVGVTANANFLYGVSCTSAAACTAVGLDGARPLVESWNGTSWSVVPSPSPGTGDNILYGVSCASAAACTAVGYRIEVINGFSVYRTLIESRTASG